jgi:hypothetical protein
MKLASIIPLYEARLNVISKHDAIERKMFGPVYHGVATEEIRKKINDEGFKIGGLEVGKSNGFQMDKTVGYVVPPPHDFLGFGVYLTTVKAIAKMFNGDSTKGLSEYYIDAPRLETINFGSTNTIMRWWMQNGYDFKWPAGKPHYDGISHAAWMRSTQNLTDTLKSKWDAVWYKGKGMRKLLDGDQVCVYDPSRIYRVDPSLSAGTDIGSKVTHNQQIIYSDEYIQEHHLEIRKTDDWTLVVRPAGQWPDGRERSEYIMHYIPPVGMKGIVVGHREMGPMVSKDQFNPRFGNQATHWIEVKWQRGGVKYNYIDAELEPLINKPER